eukprot:4860289-Lingulodinium_polyedra.AAC.1
MQSSHSPGEKAVCLGSSSGRARAHRKSACWDLPRRLRRMSSRRRSCWKAAVRPGMIWIWPPTSTTGHAPLTSSISGRTYQNCELMLSGSTH